jgi:hypothetical protein
MDMVKVFNALPVLFQYSQLVPKLPQLRGHDGHCQDVECVTCIALGQAACPQLRGHDGHCQDVECFTCTVPGQAAYPPAATAERTRWTWSRCIDELPVLLQDMQLVPKLPQLRGLDGHGQGIDELPLLLQDRQLVPQLPQLRGHDGHGQGVDVLPVMLRDRQLVPKLPQLRGHDRHGQAVASGPTSCSYFQFRAGVLNNIQVNLKKESSL